MLNPTIELGPILHWQYVVQHVADRFDTVTLAPFIIHLLNCGVYQLGIILRVS